MDRKHMVNLPDAVFDGSGAVAQGDSRLNKPLASEHKPHVTMESDMKEYKTGKPSHGKLGGKGHADSK